MKSLGMFLLGLILGAAVMYFILTVKNPVIYNPHFFGIGTECYH